jgi:transcriptional regulator with XRE-family HTH domain
MDLLKTFGARLKKLRLDQRMTQQKLAEEAGLDISYISRLERGRREPGLKNLIRLGLALKVGTERLVEGLRPDENANTSSSKALTKDLIYIWLDQHSNEEGRVTATQGRIAHDIGRSRKSVNIAIQKLKEEALIRVEVWRTGGKGGHTYQVLPKSSQRDKRNRKRRDHEIQANTCGKKAP